MSEKDFIGIDVSKAKLDVHLLCADGLRKQNCVSNDLSGFKKLLAWINRYACKPLVCLEATGHYSEGIAEYLSGKDIFVSIVNPYQVKQFGKVHLKRSKNDVADSKLIAQYAKNMSLRQFVEKPKQLKLIREFARARSMLVKQVTQLRNQLESSREPLLLRSLKQTVKRFEKEVDRYDKRLKTIIEGDAHLKDIQERLLEIKGIGEVSVTNLLAYLPDVEQFASAKALAAFTGLSPRHNQSGNYEGKSFISKIGCPELRNAFYMPALSAKRYNKALAPFVRRLERNGLKPKEIVVAVMRKLVHIIYGMLKHGHRFNPALACKP